MNRNLIILLGAGLVAALVVALLVNASRPKPVAAADVPLIQVMVARADLPAGTRLAARDIAWTDWPAGVPLPVGALTRTGPDDESVAELGTRIRRGVRRGEPVLTSTIVSDEETSFLAASLPEGMRAVALPISAESAVGGFVRPGDRVDVVMTYEVQLDSGASVMGGGPALPSPVANRLSENAANTVARDLLVLAIDQKVEDIDTDAKPGRTVTLQVTPKQAEVLILGQAMGELFLVLRGLNPGAEPPPDFTGDKDIAFGLRLAEQPAMSADPGAPMPAMQAPPTAVAIFNGPGRPALVPVASGFPR